MPGSLAYHSQRQKGATSCGVTTTPDARRHQVADKRSQLQHADPIGPTRPSERDSHSSTSR
jgi:hypothetical protein